jgi:hypothetical protein
MPALAFLAVAGLVLVTLLFVASATMKPGSPPIVTSDRIGLPEPWHSDDIQTFAPTPAPAPDTTSQTVLGGQPTAESEALTKIGPKASAARAEAPPKKKHVTQHPTDRQLNHFQQNNLVDRFSVKGQ